MPPVSDCGCIAASNTLVVWLSDNGAPPGGSNLPLSGLGYTSAEGGQRVPMLLRTFSASGLSMTPRSVMIAVISSAGVTSKAGL